MSVRLSPVLGRPRHVPVRAARAGPRAVARRRRRDHRLRHGRAARGDARVHPRGAGGRDHAARALPERGRAAGAARGDRGVGRAPLRRRAGPRHRGDSRRSGPRRPCSALAHVFGGDAWSPSRRPRTRSTSAARRSRASRSSSCRCARRDGWLPDLDARRLVARRRSCGSTTRTTRRARAPRSSSTRRPRRWRAEHGFVLASDEAYSELYFGGEPPGRALQVARPSHVAVFNTLSKRSSMPGYRVGLRRRRPGDRRRAEEVPAERRRRAAGVASSARRSPPGATRRTSTRCASATATSATPCCRRWRRSGCATRAATRRSSSGWTGPRRRARRALARGGRGRRARLVLRSRG